MAGGKETPRQRLIGLMYLVLLALLALQVSDVVMEKFYGMEKQLQVAVRELESRNTAKVAGIAKKVEEGGNKPADVARLETAKQVQEKSAALVNYINTMRQEMLDYVSGTKVAKEQIDEAKGGLYKQAKEEQKVGEFMEQKKRGEEFKAKMDEYVAFLNGLKTKHPELASVQFDPLAYDGKDDPIFKSNPEQRGKKFTELNFHHTPLVAALAGFAEKQTRVLSYSSDVLSKFSVGEEAITFDDVQPMAIMQSSIVAAGTKASGKIFVAGKDSKLVPNITLGGQALKIVDGAGEFEFTASGGNYDPETRRVKQTKAYHISLPWKGATKEFDGKLEYEVAEPQIEVSSGAVSALYLECNNPLKIKVPALGSSYNPAFTVSGGSIKKGAAIGDALVYPTAKEGVEIFVSSEGTKIGSVKFKTKPVPPPTFEIKSGGGLVDLLKGVRPGTLNVTISPKAEQGFAAACPDDAVYEIVEAEANYIVGSSFRGNRKYSSGAIRIADFSPAPGSRITVRIKKLVRNTATGDQKEIIMPEQSRFFTISIAE